jgi:phosphatidylglycerol:prolipoprotein diacylglycerol transferase
MYATLADFLQELFSGHLPSFLVSLFSYVNTFGLFVALAFLSAVYYLTKEIKRKLANGDLPPIIRTEKDKEGSVVNIELTADQWSSEIFIRAAIGGMIGAKLFHLFEYWQDVMADPMGMIFSASGLTFYGGLICGALAVLHWAYQNKIKYTVLADTVAPGLMLAYAVGRMGCQFAGDGDWGIYNTAYATDSIGQVVEAPAKVNFQELDFKTYGYFTRNYYNLNTIESAYFKGKFLPNWFFAYNYPHNVNSEGILMKNCSGNHCTVLPQPVFPTPLYEIFVGVLFFLLLWRLRLLFLKPGLLIGFYCILNGIERMSIEQIRINSVYHFFGLSPTQAEIIALCLIVFGLLLMFFSSRKKNQIQ